MKEQLNTIKDAVDYLILQLGIYGPTSASFNRIADAISDIESKLDSLEQLKNPYPEDIFGTITDEEVNELGVKAGDDSLWQRYNAAWGRRVWNNCIDDVKQTLE